MQILVSNDDGINAKGIKELAKGLNPIAAVTVVAPDRNCSGASNSLSLTNPLRISYLEPGFISVNGTPSDCVHIAIREICTKLPDIVISGINHGANLGDDTIYSGTVAAAMEGRFLGLPAIAVSLVGDKYFDTAAAYVVKIVESLKNSQPLDKNMLLNVNVPDLPIESIKGVKITRLGARHQADKMVKTTDPAGREIFWLGAPGIAFDSGEGTDFHAVENGYVSITPLTVDLTAYTQLEILQDWQKQFLDKGL